ncbi:MAG: YhbY family RNA-binding protein [Cellvibrionaceae bacterium]
MSLTNEQKKHYKTIGHSLKPVVTVAGKGLSEAVLAEMERALTDHELIKVKLAITDRDSRKEAIALISDQTGATVVQEIGKVVLLLRPAKKPNPKLSNLLR